MFPLFPHYNSLLSTVENSCIAAAHNLMAVVLVIHVLELSHFPRCVRLIIAQ